MSHTTGGRCSGLKFVFIDVEDRCLEAWVVREGGQVVRRVTPDVDYAVVLGLPTVDVLHSNAQVLPYLDLLEQKEEEEVLDDRIWEVASECLLDPPPKA